MPARRAVTTLRLRNTRAAPVYPVEVPRVFAIANESGLGVALLVTYSGLRGTGEIVDLLEE